ncbi:hypothetical protein D3C76_1597360 [compost metagenome]
MYGLHREVEQHHAAHQCDQGGLGKRDRQPGKRQEPQRPARDTLPKTLIGPTTGPSGCQGTGDAGQAKQADGRV